MAPGETLSSRAAPRSRRYAPRTPPPPPPPRATDTISRASVDVPGSLTALADMTVADHDTDVRTVATARSSTKGRPRSAGTAPPACSSHKPSAAPAGSTSRPPPAQPLPRSTSSSALRHSRSRSRSGAGSSSRMDRKHSTHSIASAATMAAAAASQRDSLLPLRGSSSSGHHIDPTLRPATVWSVFLQTVLRHANSPNAIALSGGTHHHRQPHSHHSHHSHHSSSARTSTSTSKSSNARSEVQYTWPQYYERTYAIARVLHHVQFTAGDGAVICAKSAPDVHFLNLAVLAVGGIVSHVRSTWSPDELVDDIFPACNARVLVLDAMYTNVVDALRRASERFRAVIVLHAAEPMDVIVALDAPVTVLDMDDIWSLAKTVDDVALALVSDSVTPHSCCVMAFAYDERGRVRGASLSHDNVMFTAATVAAAFGPLSSTDRLVGYLPLYHVAAQVLELYMPLVCALSVVCAPSYRESLVKVITGKKPTIFFATPDTWTHFSTQVYRAKSEVNAVLYRWAKTRATNNSKKLLFGQDAHRSLGYMLAKTLVLNNIKKRIGLESCHACYSVLAPLDFELEKLFKTIDIPIYQVFGCAETTGFAAINYPHAWEFGSSGRALRGTSITCDEVTQDVLLRGRNVFLGYVQRGAEHAPSLPHDRWFRFRQRGFLTPNGFLKINDPQDFVVLSSGDWIPVTPYEDALRRTEPELDRVVLVGEGRPFLSVLLFMKTAPVGTSRTLKSGTAPLSEDALRVGKVAGSTATTVGEAIKCQAWAVHFDNVLEALPATCGLSGFFVRKWILMADAFTVESGEIDPDTGAVKRKVVDGKYQSLLDSLYT